MHRAACCRIRICVVIILCYLAAHSNLLITSYWKNTWLPITEWEKIIYRFILKWNYSLSNAAWRLFPHYNNAKSTRMENTKGNKNCCSEESRCLLGNAWLEGVNLVILLFALYRDALTWSRFWQPDFINPSCRVAQTTIRNTDWWFLRSFVSASVWTVSSSGSISSNR